MPGQIYFGGLRGTLRKLPPAGIIRSLVIVIDVRIRSLRFCRCCMSCAKYSRQSISEKINLQSLVWVRCKTAADYAMTLMSHSDDEPIKSAAGSNRANHRWRCHVSFGQFFLSVNAENFWKEVWWCNFTFECCVFTFAKGTAACIFWLISRAQLRVRIVLFGGFLRCR